MENDLNKLCLDAKKSPITHIIIVTLLGLGIVCLPIELLFGLFIKDKVINYLVSNVIIRLIVAIFVIILAKKYGFIKPYSIKPNLKSIIFLIPAFIVAINNFPFIALSNGNMLITTNAIKLILFALYCMAISLFEEALFRGIVFPLCLYLTKKFKHSLFWAIVISSAVFSLSHIINLFYGMNFLSCLLQLGYTFLIGAMFAISLCVSKSIFVPILLHFIYDLGGLIISAKIGIGNQWDTATIVITAIIGVLTAVYMVWLTYKLSQNKSNGYMVFDIKVFDIEDKLEE